MKEKTFNSTGFFAGKNVVITGCSRGIGYKILEEFFLNGANVWACVRKESAEFDEKIQDLLAQSENENWIKPIYFDMESEEEVKQAAKQIIGEKQIIDIVVNNAGITSRSTLHMMSMKELKKVYTVNLFSQLLFTSLLSRYMIRNKKGSIINISSVSGLDNAEGTLAYGGSKASVAWSTKTLAIELGKYNIRVNAVAPGLIETDMISYKSDEEIKQLIDGNCIKRMGQAEDVANAVLFLASDKASYITGQVIRVDGGKV